MRRAICVGCTYLGGEKELRGPANDAVLMGQFLAKECGFQQQNIHVLVDAAPSFAMWSTAAAEQQKLVPVDDYSRLPTRSNIMK